MPFVIQDDIPIPGFTYEGANAELVKIVGQLEIGQCTQFTIDDLNWSFLPPGTKPDRTHLVGKISSVLTAARRTYRDRKFTYRMLGDKGAGIWRVAPQLYKIP